MLSIGIVGLPNVGKSTLFKALTKKQIDIQNYPFTTIDPNVGTVGVPDERLELLAKMSNSRKVVPTAIEFIDIAGLVRGAATGEGLGNKFLANIREVDAIAEVVRVFEDEKITHVHKKIDPANDIEVINTELMLADLETVNKRFEKTKGNDEKTKGELVVLNKLKNGLEKGELVINIKVDEKELPIAQELNLLTNKKFIYVLNASEKQLKETWPGSRTSDGNKVAKKNTSEVSLPGWQPDEKLKKVIGDNEFVVLSSTFELLLSESSPEEQKIFIEDLSLKESGLDNLIKKAYATLGLITFLTTGEDETRAWACKIGTAIPQAARAIHTDFEQKFIRAEVISWQDLLAADSHSTGASTELSRTSPGQAWSNARQSGKLRVVGRDYVVQDGDVVEIKI